MSPTSKSNPTGLSLFLCGDVMIGRAIDQILPYSVDPQIYEPYVKDARDYILMAERKNGKIPQPADYSYIWGDALQVWEQLKPDLKIINLETSITLNPKPWPEKVVQYRMHPENTAVLTAAGIDFCSLANNHTLDWGRIGLMDTIQVLSKTNIAFAGAGQDASEAIQPAVLKTPKGRVIVFAFGSETSGIPKEWEATTTRPGINLLPDLGEKSVQLVTEQVKSVKMPGDIVVFSIHWGTNWGYDIPPVHRDFTHQLIDNAGIDLIVGHSSHHPRPVEMYKDKLIMYGAGDFLNDYEGISGHELFRGDLTLMYFPEIDVASGKLISLVMIPMQLKNFRLNRASQKDAAWLADLMNNHCSPLGGGVVLQDDYLLLSW